MEKLIGFAIVASDGYGGVVVKFNIVVSDSGGNIVKPIGFKIVVWVGWVIFSVRPVISDSVVSGTDGIEV